MSRPGFQRYQSAFTEHIRAPRSNARPHGVPARRMKVYNELLFNNIKGFLDACFPVSRQLLGEKRWTQLARHFFATHRATTPLFRQIPEEFVRFLSASAQSMRLPDYLRHLAHYEWVELAIDVMDREVAVAGTNARGNLVSGRPVLNPVSLLLVYPYAVHKIGNGYRPRPNQTEETHVIVFRSPKDDSVRFVVLNAVSARLVALLQDGNLTGREALERIAFELNHPEPATVIAGGKEILESLKREGAILGTRTTAQRVSTAARTSHVGPD